MSEITSHYRTLSSNVQAKRVHKTPPAFSLLKTMIFSKSKNPASEIFRMSSVQFTRNQLKRPQTSLKPQDNLKIVGQSHHYYKYYETETKPQTSQSTLRKCQISISKHTIRGKSECSYTPKQDFKDPPKQDVEIDQVLNRNSAKLQMLYQEKQLKVKSVVLILSVQFIFQESKFWKQDQIEEDVVKSWKKLQSMATIVWLAKKAKSYKKMQMFAQKMQIPLDTIYLIRKPKKKKVITINLKQIELDLNLKSQQRVIYISTLCLNHSSERNNQHYLNKFPITRLKNCCVHFLESDQLPKNLLNNIPNVIQKQSAKVLKIQPILEKYRSYLGKYQNQRMKIISLKYIPKNIQQNLQEEDTEQYTLRNMEKLKGIWIKDILNKYKMEGKERFIEKDSIQYIVGDLLKRNFDVMNEIKVQSQNLGIPSQLNMVTQECQNFTSLKYNNMIFLWKF